MDLRIALLGWGSLIWKPEPMKIDGRWHFDGPLLPIEFARISKDLNTNRERLTLVLYDDAKQIPVLWVMLENTDLNSAILNLAGREGCKLDSIGFVRCDKLESNCRVIPSLSRPIRDWATSKKLDAVIWTDLPSNFYERTGSLLTEYNLIQYLRNIRKSGNKDAIDYVKNAPVQIKTRFRDIIEKEFKLTS